jgi:polysaccharide biosynthesis protein PslH
MRILFLTQVLPYPLDAGPKTRAYFVLRYLAQKHDVTLVSFVRATDTAAAVDHLRQFCVEVHTVPIVRSMVKDVGYLAQSLVTNQPFIITRDASAAMDQLLSSLLQGGTRFDAVHADQLWMAPYALKVQKASATPLRTVLDQHNAVFMIFQRLAEGERNPARRAVAALEAKKLARYEVDICTAFDHVVWVTCEDLAAVQRVAPTPGAVKNDGVIPICVDPQTQTMLTRVAVPQRVTFLGGLHYPPNAQGLCWFAEHIFPKVRAEAPDAVLTAIGKQPPQALANLGIPPANLQVTGYVDDPRPYLTETAAFIVPLLAGGGMRVKILDAWSWGLPMVSTSVGAEGIKIAPDENILIADEPDAFAAATVALLADPQLNHRISTAGRRWIEQNYDWHTVYAAWDKVYGRG